MIHPENSCQRWYLPHTKTSVVRHGSRGVINLPFYSLQLSLAISRRYGNVQRGEIAASDTGVRWFHPLAGPYVLWLVFNARFECWGNDKWHTCLFFFVPRSQSQTPFLLHDTKKIMSPHSSQVDVEEVQRISLLSNPDAQVDGSIELSDYSGDGNPASSNLIVRGDDDVEAVQTTPARPSFDAQVDGDIELAPLASLTVETRHLERSISRERFHEKIWTCVIDWFYDWWMGELLSMLLSVVAFCSFVAVLLKYDDQILSTLPHNVNLNFLISTLATVSKSSLLLIVASALSQFKWLWMMSSKQRRLQDLQDFDEVSRGPLGAVQLLTSSKIL